jgi:hypothetical protein
LVVRFGTKNEKLRQAEKETIEILHRWSFPAVPDQEGCRLLTKEFSVEAGRPSHG